MVNLENIVSKFNNRDKRNMISKDISEISSAKNVLSKAE